MAQPPSLIGQQLGNYRLTTLLGEGGFAEVYLGAHTIGDTGRHQDAAHAIAMRTSRSSARGSYDCSPGPSSYRARPGLRRRGPYPLPRDGLCS